MNVPGNKDRCRDSQEGKGRREVGEVVGWRKWVDVMGKGNKKECEVNREMMMEYGMCVGQK